LGVSNLPEKSGESMGRFKCRYQPFLADDQFKGLNLKDFAGWEVAKAKGSGKLASIKNPATSDPDFAAIMRGVKKNLVLMQHFAGW
jgi:hypothetical protein